MWQVDFYIAVEQELARQRELERRWALRDAVRPDGRGSSGLGGLRRLPSRLRGIAGGIAAALGSSLDRPAVGPHHL